MAQSRHVFTAPAVAKTHPAAHKLAAPTVATSWAANKAIDKPPIAAAHQPPPSFLEFDFLFELALTQLFSQMKVLILES